MFDIASTPAVSESLVEVSPRECICVMEDYYIILFLHVSSCSCPGLIERSLVTATMDSSREHTEIEHNKFVTLAQLRAHRITDEG